MFWMLILVLVTMWNNHILVTLKNQKRKQWMFSSKSSRTKYSSGWHSSISVSSLDVEDFCDCAYSSSLDKYKIIFIHLSSKCLSIVVTTLIHMALFFFLWLVKPWACCKKCHSLRGSSSNLVHMAGPKFKRVHVNSKPTLDIHYNSSN